MSRRFRRPATLQLESLETRDAPATLVSSTKLTYQDIDGDNVTVTFSKPIQHAVDVNNVFDFDVGSVDGDNTTKQQLYCIDLAALGGLGAGTTITTSAVRSPMNGGDGFAALGHIDATNLDLGAVTIDGDLGRIVAGDGNFTTPGAKGLTVQLLGRFGTTTGAPDLNTVVQGRLDFLRVKSDMKDARVELQGGADGDLGAVTIGGSLLGGSASESGQIRASGDMGLVTIGGDVRGGSGANSGNLLCEGKIAGVTIGGSVRGGAGDYSGGVWSVSLGAVKIGGDVVGGGGAKSGAISGVNSVTGVTIGGSLLGGTGNFSGWIHSSTALGAVKITSDVVGGTGIASGQVFSEKTLGPVTIAGSLQGGDNTLAGSIESFGDMGLVKIGGDVVGAFAPNSGVIFSLGKIAGVAIGGSLHGNGMTSGRIHSKGALGLVTIGGD